MLKSIGRSNLFLSLHLLVFIDLICILLLLFTPPPSSLSSYQPGLFHSFTLFLISSCASVCLFCFSSYPLSTSFFPPYLTGCHYNSTCRRVNRVYLLFLSSSWLDEHCCCIMCAWGIDERKKRREGSFQFIEMEGLQPPSLCLCSLYSFFLFVVQLNPSPCSFLCHLLPLIKLCMECAHAGEQVSSELLAALKLYLQMWSFEQWN